MSLTPLDASQPRPLPTTGVAAKGVTAALSQPALGSSAPAAPMEVVQLSAGAVLRQVAAVLGAAVGQVAAALAATPGTALSAPVSGPVLPEGRQETVPEADRQPPASTSDLRPGAPLTRLQSLTAAVGEAASVVGAAVATAAASPTARAGPSLLFPAQGDEASPQAALYFGMAPPNERHLTEPARAAADALRGATEILVAVRGRMEEAAREPAAGTLDVRDLAGTVTRAEAQVTFAFIQFGGMIPPLPRAPVGRHGGRQLRLGGHGGSGGMHLASWAGSTGLSARFPLLMAMLCVAGLALGLLVALDRPWIRVACAMVLLVTGATFATRRLRAWMSTVPVIHVEQARKPGYGRRRR